VLQAAPTHVTEVVEDGIPTRTYPSFVGGLRDALNETDTVLLESQPGTGKTTAICDAVTAFPRVVVVTFRTSLASMYTQMLHPAGFGDYRKVQKNGDGNYHTDEYPRLVIQLDSLWRLQGGADLLVLDEASYTIDHAATTFIRPLQLVWHTLARCAYTGPVSS